MTEKHDVEQPKLADLADAISMRWNKPQNENKTPKQKKEPVYSHSDSGEGYIIKDGKGWIDSRFYSFVRIGMKVSTNEEHWTNECKLDPQKKTLICFGGDQTRTERAANGCINRFTKALGFTREQLDNMQMLSHYFDIPWMVVLTLKEEANNFDELYNNDFMRETLKVFMPFIAKKTKVGWEKISDKELLTNVRNILITTHCYGTLIMIKVLDFLKQKMLSLDYDPKVVGEALKQIVCITNNSQLEMTENIPVTTLQRYSTTDGQFEPEYDRKYSNSYPAHLDNNVDYRKKKGIKSSFIKLRANEAVMAFDKIIASNKRDSVEHNDAFFETDPQKLTKVGREQMKLIQLIAQYWYNNHDEIPDAMNLLKIVAKGTDLELFVATSILNGNKLKNEHNNPLRNPHSLKVAVNRFKKPDIEPEHTGIWKLLEKKQEHN